MNENVELRKKVKRLHNKTYKQQSSLNALKDLLSKLQSKNLLGEDQVAVMEKCFDGQALDLFQSEAANHRREPCGRRYSQSVKQFAATLFYYSPQAYRYCRSILSLPSESFIRNWISNVTCDPGFLTDVIKAVSNFDCKDFSLVIDSMSIKKQTLYANGNFSGFCDYGGIVAEDTDSLCLEALVFLLIPLVSNKMYYPVGYFLVDKITSRVQAELVKTVLQLTASEGLKIRNITCDGAASNQRMLSLLGCIIDPFDPKSYFEHPTQPHKVYATLDVCHMLKLSRNALADCKSFFSDEGTISWSYITNLSKMQDDIGLRLGNKLTKKHVLWYQQKMKVKLAAQTLSSSVADALQYLKEAGVESFKECDATVTFLRQVICF